MNILINASNLFHLGGAAQVTDSICKELQYYPNHKFIVVFSENFKPTADAVATYSNVKTIFYAFPQKDWKSLFTKHNVFLDTLVETEKVDCVLTVFGPSKWVPRCRHISGFAIPHLPFSKSPFFENLSFVGRLKMSFFRMQIKYLLGRSADILYTENPLVSDIIQGLYPRKRVFTITNNYNQIFDQPDNWGTYSLPAFDGVQILCVSSMMPHKNLRSCVGVAENLIRKHPEFRFRFVLTVDQDAFGYIPDTIKEHFYFTSSVHISKVPFLYKQCDIVFQPSLLECFSASYPEAMRMCKPLVVPDLPFATGLCGNAASYFEPKSTDDASEKIYQLALDSQLINKLVTEGTTQLRKYDNYKQRAAKLIKLCEDYDNL